MSQSGESDQARQDLHQPTDLAALRPGSPNELRLINTALGADGKTVHVHFMVNSGQVLTVQLERALALRFHQSLGSVLDQALNSADLRWN